LPLEEHGCRWPEEEHSGQRFVATRTGQQVTAQTAPRVGNLIVVLEEGHKRRWLQPKGRGAAALLLPCVALSLVQVSSLERRNKLLGCAQIVGVIGFMAPRQRDHGAMVKVVVP
jgi:hypothetical protein